MGRKKNIPIGAAVVIVGLLFLQQTGLINIDDLTDHSNQQTSSSSSVKRTVNVKVGVDYGTVSDTHPSESLAKTVLTDDVVRQLNANKVSFNSAGAYIVNDNQTNLNAAVNVAPYVQLAKQDSFGRPGRADAFLNRSSREYQSRADTGNAKTIEPVGWHQSMIGGRYNTLYNRGHLIGYALAGSIRSFDPSEANAQNIATQTAWANQASNGNSENTGQNYYETLVRKALDSNRTVRYRVTPIYVGNDLVPSGNHMEAKSKDGKLQFNVFIPNVEPGVKIDYATGESAVVK